MSIKKTNLRFNLNKEVDKKAWKYLQTIDESTYKSVNRFVIFLINAYAENREKEKAETELVEKIVSAIRNELNAIAPLQLFQLLGKVQPYTQSEQNSAENEAQALDFLNSFGDGK